MTQAESNNFKCFDVLWGENELDTKGRLHGLPSSVEFLMAHTLLRGMTYNFGGWKKKGMSWRRLRWSPIYPWMDESGGCSSCILSGYVGLRWGRSVCLCLHRAGLLRSILVLLFLEFPERPALGRKSKPGADGKPPLPWDQAPSMLFMELPWKTVAPGLWFLLLWDSGPACSFLF